MTVTMEHKNGRKSSWDSKMSVSTVSTGTRHYRRSASSILSTDSDIRFTRKKLSSQHRCGCCIVTAFLILLLLAGAAVYIAYTYFFSQLPREQTYRASFKVIDGDIYSMEMADPSTERFKVRAQDYRERLNLLFRRSYIRHGFTGAEVLALDGVEGKDLTVHFNVRIDPSYIDVDAEGLKELLRKEIAIEESLYFKNLTIDARSLEVKESDAPIHSTTTPKPTTMKVDPVTKLPEPPRRCTKLQLPYCTARLGYNITSYPNIFGHKSLLEVQNDMITFREIVDAECFNQAYDFVCALLQPSCRKGVKNDEMILPCKSFCREFMQGCGSRLQPRIKSVLDCNHFPEFTGIGSCIYKPNSIISNLTSENVGPNGADGVTIGDKKPLNRSLEQIGGVQPNQIPTSAMFIPTIVVDTLTNTNGQNSSELIDNLDVNSDNNDTRIDSDGDVSDF